MENLTSHSVLDLIIMLKGSIHILHSLNKRGRAIKYNFNDVNNNLYNVSMNALTLGHSVISL